MTEIDSAATARDRSTRVRSELVAGGFDGPEEIGRGGFGIVYRCRESRSDRLVAVKLLLSEVYGDERARFVREQRALGRLSGHPHIVAVLRADLTAGGRPYLVMPYHAQGSLDRVLRANGPLRWPDAVSIGVRMAGALAAAHALGIVHGDVKPANILLTDYGEPQLSDFGIARSRDDTVTTVPVRGTPAFTAPEVLDGAAPTAVADVYGLGATLYYLVTGHSPADRPGGAAGGFGPDLHAHVVPGAVGDVLAAALAPDPADRPATAVAFGEMLRDVQRATGRPVDGMAAPPRRDGVGPRGGDTGLPGRGGGPRREGVGPRGGDTGLPGRGGGPRRDGAGPRGGDTGLPGRGGGPRREGVGSHGGGPGQHEGGGGSHGVDGAKPAPVPVPPAGASPPVALTDLRPPVASRSLIDRTRLLDILRAAGRRRLVVIHGPAGFGKTTLAIQWAHELRSAGVPVAWLTADEDDDDLVWFLSHLIEALRRVRPELARELGALLEERSSNATRSVLAALIDEIHRGGQRIALVIDDWHRVHGRRTRVAVDYLLEHGCHHLQLVVVGRSRAGLPMSKLRVAGELVEIDTAQLRFDAAETDAFLVGASGLELTADEVARIRESTEGWAAGLRLAQLSLSGREDPSGFIDNLSGRHHAIGEYLTENVLDSLEPPLLDFLMTTSITSRICAGLATALSGRADSAELLDQVADRNLFLHREETDDGEWFRYHRLFADHLQRRLGYWDPDRVQVLHARAGDWFAEHGKLVEAVDHALAAGDPERAVDLVEQHVMPLLLNSRMATILGLMAKLPASLTDLRPRLQLAAAWANVGLERGLRVHGAVRKIDAAIEASHVPEPQATAYRVEAALVVGMEEYVADRLENLPDIVPEHLDSLDNLVVALTACDLAAVDALNRFDFAGVRHWHAMSLRYGRTLPSLSVMHSHCIAGLAEVEQVHPHVAERHFTTAFASISPGSELVDRATELAGAYLGDLRYRQNRLDEAEELLAAVVRGPCEPRGAEVALAAYGTGARLAAIRGELDRAEELLTAGERMAQERSLPRLSARLTNERLRIGLPIPAEVRDRLLNLPLYRKQHTRIRAALAELAQESAIRMLLADGTSSAVAAACARAEVMYREIGAQNRPRGLVDASLLYACCLWTAGDHETACAIAGPALSVCVEGGVPRLAQDAGAAMTEISAAVGPNRLPHLGS
ncbi:serine/threonine-protein kinase [Nocardia sp. alder85J]|uniref:serine/threonine-protein kinase n=1 Tax=Nocardia sp. alder85J TaxID=2862949 RepID=UPI001CD20483|nr:serine/threonine-protein kinase [Nocardia sp. alder85J]MCX4092978.1 protein kinase [Nocardia sp. alder85J]